MANEETMSCLLETHLTFQVVSNLKNKNLIFVITCTTLLAEIKSKSTPIINDPTQTKENDG